jgi:hypothetical protein
MNKSESPYYEIRDTLLKHNNPPVLAKEIITGDTTGFGFINKQLEGGAWITIWKP